MPFESNKVISLEINNTSLSAYLVGFDYNDSGAKEYRWGALTKVLLSALHEYAFGFHEGTKTDNTEILDKLTEAASSIYKIDNYKDVGKIYLEGGCLSDDIEDKYKRRGEFGELILHLLLRDYYSTIPLISKIYFKDTDGATVHGFDAVHVNPNDKTLWLGESKLYLDPKLGIKALIGDIKDHIKRDYLNREFALISKKVEFSNNIEGKETWLELLKGSTKLSDQINAINMPLLCTYSSKIFSTYDDETCEKFKVEYENEINELYELFEKLKPADGLASKVNVILLLFPVKCKIELIKRLHTKVALLKEVGES